MAVFLGLLSSVSISGFGQTQGGLDRAEPIGAFLGGALPPTTPRPSTGSWRLVNAFPSLTFIDPVQMLPVPFSNRLLVLEKSGRLVVFENAETTGAKTVLLDIRGQVESSHDSGMVGLAFHPEFGMPDSPNRHYLYVYYRFTPQKSQTDPAFCRLSRFTWDPATNAIAASSEFVLINQYDRHNWHNGGGLFFGLDGFLYLSIGDEGGSNDQYNATQRLDSALLAGVLRLDVDRDPSRSHPIRRQPRNPATPPSGWPNSYSQGYYIPNDNPWQSPDGSRLEEFYAIGLRSPHRMTQDPVTGQIWVGDVGQGTQEEVSRIVRGGNLQWPYREGSVAGPKAKPSPLIGTDVTPVHAYGRSTGTCVIGGYIYRGALHPELEGKYLFGDHGSGQIWSLDASGGSPVVTSLLTLSTHGPGPKNGMGAFGIDASGEIYVLSLAGTDLDGGRVYRLEKTTEGVPEPPRLLSQTTAFSNLADLTPAPGVMPYDVIQPLWSDAAEKQRWIAIPSDGTPNTSAERIGWSEEGNWTFPNGTVLIKHFEVPGRRLETRFFVRGTDGLWFGFTYRWREDGSDAELLAEEPLDETFTVNGTTRTWHFPGRNECASCHTDAAGKVLGLRTRQLNRDYFYETTGRSANQLVTLNRLGFLSPAIDESRLPNMLTSRAQGDSTATLERRARSYLDVNCAHCHQPGAPTQAAFDARLTTPPWSQNLINVAPGNNLGIAGAGLVRPGRVDLSVIHRRAGSTAAGVAMPPIAKNLVDAAGLQLLSDWIASLDPAIGPSGPVTGTPPRDSSTPILTLTPSGGSNPAIGPFTVALTASESILGLTTADFTVVNGSVSNLAGSGTSWTFTVTPGAAGPGSVSIAADRVTDTNGNANATLSAPLIFTYQTNNPPANRITNGGFENGLSGWDRGGSVATTATSHSGAAALSMGASTWLVHTLPVSELSNYLFTGWFYSTTPGARAEAGLSFWDANGVWVEDRVVPLDPINAWKSFELAFTAPVGARSVAVWVLTNGIGGILLDDLSIVEGGAGEPRPVFGPSFTNLLENGGFESGLSVWDRGGSVELSSSARSGSQAARLAGDSFVVQSKTATPGRRIALFGAYRTESASGPFEAGFTFYDSSGAWITDRFLPLTQSTTYATFLVDTSIPEQAATMTVWVWRGVGSGTATIDDLALFRPDETFGAPANLFSNGGFEGGSLAPWDTGGTDVRLVTTARSGGSAAQIGSDSFIVHNQSANAGEEFLFTGHSFAAGGNAGPREAGFSFWSASGQWLGDAIATLGSSTQYEAFSVRGLVPANAVAFSAWVWCGSGTSVAIDDLVLERVVAFPASTVSDPLEAGQEEGLAGDLTMMSLKSSRSLFVSKSDPLAADPFLAHALGTIHPVYATGWIPFVEPDPDTAAYAYDLAGGERKSLATTVYGPGIVSAQWTLEAIPGSATLSLLVDGIERGRWLTRGGAVDWRTVSVPILTSGLHTVEFRLEPGPAARDGVALPVVAGIRAFGFARGFPHLQPDLALALKGGRYNGIGIYETTPARQIVRTATYGATPTKFRLRWRNDAGELDDGIRLSGPSGNRSHRVEYFSVAVGRRNITSDVILGLYETEKAAPGAGTLFDVEVRKIRPPRRQGFTGTIRAASLLKTSRGDAVEIRTAPR